jgi:PHD/YefM family antitoxin component YafN of YafNO toxin-antitoxin module
MININEHLVSVSNLVRNYHQTKEELNQKNFLTVLANNKPEMVLCSLDYFNKLMELEDYFEQFQILSEVEKARKEPVESRISADALFDELGIE